MQSFAAFAARPSANSSHPNWLKIPGTKISQVMSSSLDYKEKRKLLLERRLADIDAKLEEYALLSDSQSDLIKNLEKKDKEATRGLINAEKVLDEKLAEAIGEEDESLTDDLCSGLAEKMKFGRFEQASEVETALLKEKEDLESQVPLKQSRIDELQKSLSDINGRLNKIWFVDVSPEVTSGVLNHLRKRNRLIGLKLLQVRLERAKLDAQLLAEDEPN
ncbi:unnamed protein product [Enterobius vermicularis]|uniref:PCRF domain-containing protein n=1 Tax=Enterobius vermicularis TaxID=51028 RepID=A0A0N4UVH5_ENTVE|nr:unnamed protein product [Enterobius vermicularis]